MIRHASALIVFSVLAAASAADLAETNVDFDGMPAVVEFDCFPDADYDARYFEPINRRMRVPRHFELSESDPSWISWNVLIVGEDNESIVFPFVSIQFDEDDTNISGFLEEFEVVSKSSENGFGVDVYLREPQPEDTASDYWLFIFSGQKFLKVIARRPIDWNSLLTCFE